MNWFNAASGNGACTNNASATTPSGAFARAVTKASGAAAVGLIGAAVLAGCSAGQIAQTSMVSNDSNGSSKTVGDLGLRDVRIQALQTSDALAPGSIVDLAFVASNVSMTAADELTGITTPVGNVSLSGSTSVPVGGVLVVSPPAGPQMPEAPAADALPEIENASTGAATVTLNEPIRNGLTYDFTFNFKNAGPISLAVPITAPRLHH